MARIKLTEGFLPPFGDGFTLRAGRGESFIIQAHGADERGPVKNLSRIVDRYSSVNLPRYHNGYQWVPIYAVIPSFREFRLTLWGPEGAAGVSLGRLLFDRSAFYRGGAFGSAGFLTGDSATTPGFSLQSCMSDPKEETPGWESNARGAGPYTLSYRFLYPKFTPWYQLTRSRFGPTPLYPPPAAWKLELFLPGWGWVVADERKDVPAYDLDRYRYLK